MPNNDEVRTNSNIKLINQTGKMIGIYNASEARRKALSLGKDMVLVNENCEPVICRVIDFRNAVLNRFYEEIVVKRNE